jgi:hypothetical protein
VEGAGFAKTFRQRAADLVFRDDDINRAARAVAWLEALAAEALDSEPPAPFSAGDGVWKGTRARVAAGGAGRALGGRDSGEGVVCVPEYNIPSLFSPLPPWCCFTYFACAFISKMLKHHTGLNDVP